MERRAIISIAQSIIPFSSQIASILEGLLGVVIGMQVSDIELGPRNIERPHTRFFEFMAGSPSTAELNFVQVSIASK